MVLVIATTFLSVATACAQPGIILGGVGPVNVSMAGASAAAPIDASGALHWNQATIAGLERSEMEFGLQLLYPQSRLSSSVPAGAFGPGIPPVGLSGSDRGEHGVFTLPTFGVVYKPEDSGYVFGLGAFTVGGFGASYQGSNSNPVLMPRPPLGVGLGPIFTQLQVFQIAPTVACQLSDRLSVGIAPTLDLAFLQVDPGLIAPPDDANGDGTATYPALTHTRYHFGGGFQVGLFYKLDDGWAVGCSAKSPQWFETFRFHATDELGRPRTDRFSADYPMILTTGVSYSGFEHWLVAADVRYVDYKNTTGFRDSGFDSRGRLRGLGWDSTFAVALGVQYQWTDCLTVRAGYLFSQNPIDDSQTSQNLGSLTITEHHLALGASYRISDNLLLSAAYTHAFPNSIQSPLVTPLGTIPGTIVKSEATGADSLLVGLTVEFGGNVR